jgi:hypothetical protein
MVTYEKISTSLAGYILQVLFYRLFTFLIFVSKLLAHFLTSQHSQTLMQIIFTYVKRGAEVVNF